MSTLTVTDFITSLRARANEAVPDRLVTAAEFLLIVNETEDWIAEEAMYYHNTSVYSAGDYISALGTSPRWFDMPADYMAVDPNAEVMFGENSDIKVFNDTVKSWYAFQESQATGVYVLDDTDISDSYIRRATEYPQANRKYFITNGEKSRIAAGKGGTIFSFNPDIVAGEKMLVSYIAYPAHHVTTGETINAPQVFHNAMKRYAVSIIKEKAGDMSDADYYQEQAGKKMQRAKYNIRPDKNKNKRILSPQRARRMYRHKWT